MNKKNLAALGLLVMAAVVTGPARADYATAVAAWERKDYATAFTLMRKSAEAGDKRAMESLGMLYWNGQGVGADAKQAVKWLDKSAKAGNAHAMDSLAKIYLAGGGGLPQDVAAARQWAEKASAQGDADGDVIYYMSVISGPELNYRVDGKPDKAKYAALGKRTLAERSLDQEAYALLGKALDLKSPGAMLYAAAEMIDKVGPGNRARALAMLQQLPQVPKPLQVVQTALQGLSRIGDSYTSYTTFVTAKDALLPDVAALGTSMGVIGPGVCTQDDLKIAATAISRPLANGVYLPATQPQLQNLYLISGNWQETWTFDACGKHIDMPVEFEADGVGSAHFHPAPPAAK